MRFSLKVGSNLRASLLTILLVAQRPMDAQTLPTSLQIITVKGEGVAGRVQQRAMQEPVVRVVDENDKPIAGAAVVFTLPTEGATGAFGNSSKTLTLVTDASGVASAQGLRFNQIPGKVPVHVNASYKGLTARNIITQFSEAPAGYKPGGGHGKVIAILGIIAAAGAGGAYYAISQNKPSPSTPPPPAGPPPIGITPGTGTIAPPR